MKTNLWKRKHCHEEATKKVCFHFVILQLVNMEKNVGQHKYSIRRAGCYSTSNGECHMRSFLCEYILNKEIWKCLWVKNVVHVIYDVKQRRVVYGAQLPDGMDAWLNDTQDEEAPTCYSENTMGRILDSLIPFMNNSYFLILNASMYLFF